MLRRSNPASVAKPVGRYSHTTSAPAGTELVFVSGQVGNYPDGRPLDGDAAGQARQALANLGAILADLGATPAEVVKMTTLVVGEANLAGFRAARDEVFAEWYPDGSDPAHTLIVVVALAAPELLIEIEAVVAVASG